MKRAISISISTLLIVLSSCRPSLQEESLLKVGNGKEISSAEEDQYTKPIVMLSSFYEGTGYRGFCTSTFVNDTTIITALHCIERNGTTILPSVETPTGYVKAINSFYNQEGVGRLVEISSLFDEKEKYNADFFKIDSNCNRNNPSASDVVSKMSEISQSIASNFRTMTRFDLAILVFPKGTGDSITGGKGYYGISESEPNVHARVKFIGFGNNTTEVVSKPNTCATDINAEGFGKKRQGTNTLTRNGTDGFLEIIGYRNANEAEKNNTRLGEDVSVAPGDSGGPWILCSSIDNCNSHDLIGVNSTANFSNQSKNYGQGVTLHSKESKDLIREAILCSEADESMCASNFKGSGVEGELNQNNDQVFLALFKADAGDPNKVKIGISVPAEATNVSLCTNREYDSCTSSNSLSIEYDYDSKTLDNKIYKVVDVLELSETESNYFSIVGRSTNGAIVSFKVLEIAKK